MTIPTDMYGLLVPNGAGKSTLMRTIATLQEPDSGSISLVTLMCCLRRLECGKFSVIYHMSLGFVRKLPHGRCWTILQS
ncbi:MAG: ATP-binding cassette domain-containing protein [Rubripirellula sp.]